MPVYLHYAWGIAEARCIVVTAVCVSLCVSVCLSVCPSPHSRTISGLTAQVGWLGLRVGGHPELSLHSSVEPGELLQWPWSWGQHHKHCRWIINYYYYYCMDPDISWGGFHIVVHYWMDLQLVHGFCCCYNIVPNTKCWRVLLTLCLVAVG